MECQKRPICRERMQIVAGEGGDSLSHTGLPVGTAELERDV
jgi:hypothetical protein